MALALWCEDPDKGHAFDEREAIIVDPDGTPQFFCKSHAIGAFAIAFHLADIAGSAGIVVPALGGAFTVMPADAQPAPGAPAGDGTGQRDKAPDGSRPGNAATVKAAAGENASTAAPGTDQQRHARATRSAQALADLIEQEPRPGSRTPASRSMEQRFPVRLWLLSDRVQALILAWDASSRPPARINPGDESESGRGLLLVDAISTRWGWFYPQDTADGKTVWAPSNRQACPGE